MSFDDAAVRALFAALVSHTQDLGLFDRVGTHEPKNAPGRGLTCAIWIQSIAPTPAASGLAATSGRVEFAVRIYTSMLSEPQDQIDPDVLAAATTLLNEYSGAFSLGGSVRNVDLLGQHGTALSAQAGYLTQDSKTFRVMVVTLPIIISDMWGQAA